MSDEKAGVFIRLPLPEFQVFRYQAADDILELLYRNPHREFTITQLRESTGHGGKSVDMAVEILEGLDLLERRRDGRQSLTQINQSVIEKPGDPILEIPQEEFRPPVRAFLERVEESQGENLVSVILFGSVARGQADRTSDIDIQVLVREDLLEARRTIHDIRQTLEKRRFDGNRYELEVLIESIEGATNYGAKLEEIFTQGIVLYSSDGLQSVTEAIFSGQ